MMRTLIAGALLVGAIIALTMQNQKLRTERNAFKDRLGAVAGAREIENVTSQIDDCGLIGLLIGGRDMQPDDGGAVLGCAEDAAQPPAQNSGVSGSE